MKVAAAACTRIAVPAGRRLGRSPLPRRSPFSNRDSVLAYMRRTVVSYQRECTFRNSFDQWLFNFFSFSPRPWPIFIIIIFPSIFFFPVITRYYCCLLGFRRFLIPIVISDFKNEKNYSNTFNNNNSASAPQSFSERRRRHGLNESVWQCRWAISFTPPGKYNSIIWYLPIIIFVIISDQLSVGVLHNLTV